MVCSIVISLEVRNGSWEYHRILFSSIQSSSHSIHTSLRRPTFRCVSLGSPGTLPLSTLATCALEQRRMPATSLTVRTLDKFGILTSTLYVTETIARD